MSGPQVASDLLPQQIILISVPVGDLISSLSLFFFPLNLAHLKSLLSLSTIPLSYCQEGKETWGFGVPSA